MLINIENVWKSYGERQILADVTLYLKAGDRVGVVGVNGCGKSTLLKLAAGISQPDEGSVTLDPNVRTSYLGQDPAYDPDCTVLDYVLSLQPSSARKTEEYEALEILTRLGLPDRTAKMGELSGGQRKRAALAGCLAADTDVLILDEPTNHLDVMMIEWLEDYLERFSGAVLFVSHDRYFLERLATRTAEVSFSALYVYEGGYSAWLDGKARREESEAAGERKRQSVLRRELQWVLQGPCARGTKSRERLARYEALKAKQPPQLNGELQAVRVLPSRLGRRTIELKNAEKSYGGKRVVPPFSCVLLRDDRIGIVGVNGCGKTTLLNLFAGKITPDAGSVTRGETVRLGYFSQHTQDMDPEQTAIEYVKERGDRIETADGPLSASKLMENFLFPPELQYRKIGRLSGGEKRRLFLLGILMLSPNVLLLDEPTNDLDVPTLRVLEEYLVSFPGAVVAVSHDRYFLDRVCKRVFLFTPEGELVESLGSFSEYAALLAKRESRKEKNAVKPEPEQAPVRKQPPAKLKFSYNEQREYASIEDRIAELEAELEQNQADQQTYCSDYLRLEELTARQKELEALLEEKMDRWAYLSELAEKIAAQNAR